MRTAPITFDPAMCQDVETNQMLQQAYEGLVQYSPDNKIVPCLAERWDISKDGLTYTFHLRRAQFQNGSPVTAEDVAYSLRRALDPALSSPIAKQYLGDIAGALDVYSGKTTELRGVKVIDPQTLAVTITSPKAYWIDTLTYPTAWVACKAIAVKEGTRPLTDADAALGAGSGAFRITRFLKDQEVDMDANPRYWGGAPRIAGQVHKIILDAGTRHAEFARGDLDLMRGLQIGDLDADRKDAALRDKIKLWPRAGVFYFALNQNAYAPFNDPRVRQAFACATDKQKVVSVVTEGLFPPPPTCSRVASPAATRPSPGRPSTPLGPGRCWRPRASPAGAACRRWKSTARRKTPLPRRPPTCCARCTRRHWASR